MGPNQSNAILRGREDDDDVVRIKVSNLYFPRVRLQALGIGLQTNRIEALCLLNATLNQMHMLQHRIVNCHSLVSLEVSESNLTSICCKDFCVIFQNNAVLRELTLSGNRIDNEGAIELAKALETNKSLRVLNLQHNWMGPRAASAFALALQVNTTLTKLDLSYNQMRDMTEFATMLETNCTLEELNLSRNQLGFRGATEIGRALKYNRALLVLSLSTNQLRDLGAQAIGEAVQHNTTLHTLDLTNNRIEDYGIMRLLDGIRLNTTLNEVDIRGNSLFPLDHYIGLMASTLEHNRSRRNVLVLLYHAKHSRALRRLPNELIRLVLLNML